MPQLSEMQTHSRELTAPYRREVLKQKLFVGRALSGPFNNLRSIALSAMATLFTGIIILISTSSVSWTNIKLSLTLKLNEQFVNTFILI